MKIIIEEINNLLETEVIIKCIEKDEYVQKIEKSLKMLDFQIIAKKEDMTYTIHPQDIYYFESIENIVYAYSQKDVFVTTYKLYEIESLLSQMTFLRVHKNTILNASKIKHFKSTINGRMEATLKNNEKVIISRNYVSALKLMLGGPHR